jgi:hypothetical protein
MDAGLAAPAATAHTRAIDVSASDIDLLEAASLVSPCPAIRAMVTMFARASPVSVVPKVPAPAFAGLGEQPTIARAP